MFIAATRGLVDTNGYFWFTLTPLNEPWILDEIVLATDKETGERKYSGEYVSIYENMWNPETASGFLTTEGIESYASKLTDIEKKTRLYGEFAHLSGRVFDSFDPSKPFYSMAKAYTEIFINRSERIKQQYIADMVKKFKIDGIIFHDSRTCPNNSNARYGMPGRMREKFGIPSLIISGDLNDLRCYSEEQARTNIEAFVEQLAEA